MSGNEHLGSSLPLMARRDLPWQIRKFVTRAQGKCAQCGEEIIAPEWSEHLSERRIRNVWSCDACGYQFEDDVNLRA